MKCLTLSRETKWGTQWLIANGAMMGRWTMQFSAPCLGDTDYCKEFVRNIAAETPEAIIKTFEIIEISG